VTCHVHLSRTNVTLYHEDRTVVLWLGSRHCDVSYYRLVCVAGTVLLM